MGYDSETLKKSVAVVCSRASELTRKDVADIHESIHCLRAKRLLLGESKNYWRNPMDAVFMAKEALWKLCDLVASQDNVTEFDVGGCALIAIEAVEGAIEAHYSSAFSIDYDYSNENMFCVDVHDCGSVYIYSVDGGIVANIYPVSAAEVPTASCNASAEQLGVER